MISRFREFIEKQQLFAPSSKFLAAVSGGVDSVVMCHLLSRSGYKFAVAHCNFQLRGKESDLDEAFVLELGKSLNVQVHVIHFDTLNFAQKLGVSTQMAARELRYDWFRRLQNEMGYDCIATAHHSSDVSETLLLNLTKGTGIAGLHGIREKHDDVVRPLLFAGRDEIVDYARQNDLRWREDQSNQSTKYQRNLIRINVIPELKKINPSFEETLGSSVEKLRAVEDIFRKEVKRFRELVCTETGERYYFDIEKIRRDEHALIKLYEILKLFGFTYDQVKDIMESLDVQSGKTFSSSSFIIIKDRKELILEKLSTGYQNEFVLSEPSGIVQGQYFKLNYSVKKAEHYKILPDKEIAALDFSMLSFPLTLRLWKQGDKMMPLGMKQFKKVSDILIDQKVSLADKRRLYVLQSGEDIVWIPGIRIDERYKLKSDSEFVWEAHFDRKS